MKKHAVCIMAHSNWEQLDDLIETLGVTYVDVYLHIDKKHRGKFDIYAERNDFKRHANVRLLDSYNVDWGGYSQLLAELFLFKEVLKHDGDYTYVHLISGQDFPLRPIGEIVDECNKTGYDYMSFITGGEKRMFERRLRYWNILVPRIRSSKFCAYTRKAFLLLQMLLGINRLKNCPLEFEVGANWMSITIESMKYIVEKYPKYEKYFRYGMSAEECYKQMILRTCPTSNIFNDCKRYVKFEHNKSSPKVLTMDMYDDIISSGAFFARKFDDEIDKEVRIKIKEERLWTKR